MNTEEINRIRKEAIDAINKAADEALKTPKVGDWFYAKFENNQFVIGRIKEIEDLRIKFFGLTDEGWKEDEQCYVCPKESTCKTFNIMNESGVIEFLTKEAEKRYKDGDIVKSEWSNDIITLLFTQKNRMDDEHFIYKGVAVLDLETGKWAEKVKPVKNEGFFIEVTNNGYTINWGKCKPIIGKYKLVKID